MTEAIHRYRMVVALDLSEYSDVVIEHALDLAARHKACDIHIVVVHEPDVTLEDEKQRLVALTRDKLQAFRAAPRTTTGRSGCMSGPETLPIRSAHSRERRKLT